MTKKSVKMWGVFTKRKKLLWVRPLKYDADELAANMELGDKVRPVTVSWEEGFGKGKALPEAK